MTTERDLRHIWPDIVEIWKCKMARIRMDHPSRPGYYKCELQPGLRASVTAVASLLIPADGDFPAAGRIVAQFLESRVSPSELSALERIIGDLEVFDVASLSRLERESPDDFELLRFWTYQGYYGSPVIAGLIQLSGSAYHGAPQPLGYELSREAPVPSSPKGHFVPTEEVRRVSL